MCWGSCLSSPSPPTGLTLPPPPSQEWGQFSGARPVSSLLCAASEHWWWRCWEKGGRKEGRSHTVLPHLLPKGGKFSDSGGQSELHSQMENPGSLPDTRLGYRVRGSREATLTHSPSLESRLRLQLPSGSVHLGHFTYVRIQSGLSIVSAKSHSAKWLPLHLICSNPLNPEPRPGGFMRVGC